MNKNDVFPSNHIIIDKQDSWPKSLTSLLIESKQTMLCFLDEKKSIDEASVEDVILRIQRPNNKYQYEWDHIVLEVNKIIKRYMFIGFHCTRLIKCEVSAILNGGLSPLNEDLLSYKLGILLTEKIIDKKEYNEKLLNKKVHDNGRKNLVFTFHEIHTLTDESGLKRLFRCWGGEYFYAGKEETKKFSDKYFNIGKATILLTSHPYEDLQDKDIEIKIIKNFLFYNNDYRGNDFDNWHKKTVKVVGYINEDDNLFNELTGYRSWNL